MLAHWISKHPLLRTAGPSAADIIGKSVFRKQF